LLFVFVFFGVEVISKVFAILHIHIRRKDNLCIFGFEDSWTTFEHFVFSNLCWKEVLENNDIKFVTKNYVFSSAITVTHIITNVISAWIFMS